MAELSKLPPALQERVAHSLAIIYQALDTYKYENRIAYDVTSVLTMRPDLVSCPSVTMAARIVALWCI